MAPLVKRELDSAWNVTFEARVRDLIAKDSAELKGMVRQDLRRLETLMISSFDKIPSEGADIEGNRRSLSEIPSLRQSLES